MITIIMWLLLVQAFWFIAPAYAANAFPPLVKGRSPLDFHKNLGKHRILGDGKTIEGSIAGILFGLFIGSLQLAFQDYVDLGFIKMSFLLVILLSVGAILGDITGTFIKRRLGIKRGDPAILLDQLDFLAIAVVFSLLVVSLSLEIIAVLFLLTPVVHLTANYIGYKCGVKKHPW